MPVTFTVGSFDGVAECINVTVLPDEFVEGEEDFTLELILNSVGNSLSIGNNSTAIAIIDSNCKFMLQPV